MRYINLQVDWPSGSQKILEITDIKLDISINFQMSINCQVTPWSSGKTVCEKRHYNWSVLCFDCNTAATNIAVTLIIS